MELSDEARKKQREYKARWRQKNREQIREYTQEWRAANKDRVKDSGRRYWEKKAEQNSVTNTVTGKIIVTDQPGQAICISCGGFYQPKRRTAKYCSDKCRVKYNRIIKR